MTTHERSGNCHLDQAFQSVPQPLVVRLVVVAAAAVADVVAAAAEQLPLPVVASAHAVNREIILQDRKHDNILNDDTQAVNINF